MSQMRAQRNTIHLGHSSVPTRDVYQMPRRRRSLPTKVLQTSSTREKYSDGSRGFPTPQKLFGISRVKLKSNSFARYSGKCAFKPKMHISHYGIVLFFDFLKKHLTPNKVSSRYFEVFKIDGERKKKFPSS